MAESFPIRRAQHGFRSLCCCISGLCCHWRLRDWHYSPPSSWHAPHTEVVQAAGQAPKERPQRRVRAAPRGRRAAGDEQRGPVPGGGRAGRHLRRAVAAAAAPHGAAARPAVPCSHAAGPPHQGALLPALPLPPSPTPLPRRSHCLSVPASLVVGCSGVSHTLLCSTWRSDS